MRQIANVVIRNFSPCEVVGNGKNSKSVAVATKTMSPPIATSRTVSSTSVRANR